MVKLWDGVPGFDFNPEIDLSELNSYFFDGTHSVPLLTPMYAWFWCRHCGHGAAHTMGKGCGDLFLADLKENRGYKEPL
jgi:hypothetical protein